MSPSVDQVRLYLREFVGLTGSAPTRSETFFSPKAALSWQWTPATVLKANSAGSTRGQALRKVLVVVQFSIALMLIIGTAYGLHQAERSRQRHLEAV